MVEQFIILNKVQLSLNIFKVCGELKIKNNNVNYLWDSINIHPYFEIYSNKPKQNIFLLIEFEYKSLNP